MTTVGEFAQGWTIERLSGSAADFHARQIPDAPRRAVWVFEVTRPALILGSTQGESVADLEECARRGVDVVRRRSGGGAVFLAPDQVTWIDVLIPADDPLWSDDVGRSMWWLGDVWSRAMTALGIDATAVHRGGLMTNRWSRLVCFAGLGPGEVTRHGAKLVGISQRRTRNGARFQCSVYSKWDPDDVVAVLADPVLTAADLPVVASVGLPPSQVARGFVDQLIDGERRRLAGRHRH